MGQRLAITDQGVFIAFDTRVLRVLNHTCRAMPLCAFVRALFARTTDQYKVWHARYTQRRQLASLSDTALKDIGCNRIDANNEANKPFWRP